MIIRFLTLLTAFITLMSMTAQAGQSVVYKHGNTALEGYWAPSKCIKENPGKKFPTIVILHQWMGLGGHEKVHANMYANDTSLCYNAFAADIYGQGIRAANTHEARKISGQYKKSAGLAIQRIQSAIDFVRALKVVDASKIALTGYSFGGAFAIDYARSGGDVNGVVNFYGSPKTRLPKTNPANITAAIEFHHGANDPYVLARHINILKDEMAHNSVMFNFYEYEGAVHGFSQKELGNNPSSGLAYNAEADETSWARHLEFLQKVF